MNKPYWVIGLLLLSAACRSEAESSVVARPEGPILDQAGVISPAAEAALDSRLRAYWAEQKTAIVIATVTTLEGQAIEDTARKIFSDWGIGSADTHRGVLILIAPTERQARIEVGCGLETILTDPVAQQIMDDTLLPNFAAGRFADGAALGADQLIHQLAIAKVTPGPVTPYCADLMRKAA